MKLSHKVAPLVLLSLMSFHSIAQSDVSQPMGCLERINKEFTNTTNLRDELDNESSKKLGKMILPAYIPGVLLGMPGLTTAFFSIYITGIVDQVQIHQTVKTVSLLEIADKIKNGKTINSEDYYKLGVFYKLKQKIQLKSKRNNISDEMLANLIVSENNKAMDENIFCSTLRGGNVIISRMNRKLMKKIYQAFGVNEDEIAVDNANDVEKDEELEKEVNIELEHPEKEIEEGDDVILDDANEESDQSERENTKSDLKQERPRKQQRQNSKTGKGKIA
jgi:hypothetical protein